MKSLFVISQDASAGNPVPERRRNQRRMAVPRRIADRRAGDGPGAESAGERRGASDRRNSGARRRCPDRRIGLSPDLDLYLLGI